MEKITLKAETRKSDQKASELRKRGMVPGVIYNHGNTDQLTVSNSDMIKLFENGVSESTLIDITIGNKTETAFIKEYQLHPVTDRLLHIDFYRITAGEKIRTSIPIQLDGKPVGVKEGGVLDIILHDVEVETFPRFLVPALVVDISHLKIGDSLHLDEINLPEETVVMIEGNPIVCNIAVPAKLEAETAVTEDEASEEGEESKEGEDKAESASEEK